MKMSEGLEKVLDVICEILAFLTVILIVFLFVNRIVAHKASDGVGFVPNKSVKMLESIREIAVLLVLGLTGLQFSIKRGFVVFIIYAVLIAAAVIFLFFPGVLPATIKGAAALQRIV